MDFWPHSVTLHLRRWRWQDGDKMSFNLTALLSNMICCTSKWTCQCEETQSKKEIDILYLESCVLLAGFGFKHSCYVGRRPLVRLHNIKRHLITGSRVCCCMCSITRTRTALYSHCHRCLCMLVYWTILRTIYLNDNCFVARLPAVCACATFYILATFSKRSVDVVL